MKSLRAVATGHVQGVAFRWSTRREADHLGVRGWVRNLEDGRVEAQLEGDPDAVEVLVAWLRRGPTAAVVKDLVLSVADPCGAPDFRILP
ncbi:MAG: acylphosphatase [Planctomycetota bacterium]|nr:acylphosphatase [Planctomycetota bacterium]